MSDFVDPAPRRPLTRGEKLTVALLIGAFTAVVLGDLALRYEPVMWSIPLIILAWVPLLVVHETGHALAAWLVGWKVHRIVIGFGKDLFRFRIGPTRVVVKRIPVEGFVQPVPTTLSWARLKNSFIYFAGPGIEIALLLAIVGLVGYPEIVSKTASLSVIGFQAVGVAICLGLFFNLLPHESAGGASDGLGMITSLGLPRHHFEDAAALPYREQAERLIERSEPERALAVAEGALETHPAAFSLKTLRAVCLAANGEAQAASSALDALGSATEQPIARRLELLHARGRAALEAPEPGLLRDGELACNEALRIAPGWTSCEVTLGALLVERGRHEEAIRVLQMAHAATRDAIEESRALGYLAVALHRAGRDDEARLYLDAFRDSDPSPRLLQRVRGELAIGA